MPAKRWCGSWGGGSGGRLRFAFEPRGAAGLLLGRDLIQIFQLIGNLLTGSHLPFELALTDASRADFQRDSLARSDTGKLLIEIFSHRLALKLHDDVAQPEALLFGIAARGERVHRERAVKVAGGGEARVRENDVYCFYPQPDGAEEIVPGNLFGSDHVFMEEVREFGVAHGFGRLTHAPGLVEELAFLSVIAIHPLQHFAQ